MLDQSVVPLRPSVELPSLEMLVPQLQLRVQVQRTLGSGDGKAFGTKKNGAKTWDLAMQYEK